MRVIGEFYNRLARPQVVAGIVAVLLVTISFSAPPTITKPIQAASVPVIQPIEPRVEGLAITPPVDCSRVACLALTFDDGPSHEVTPKILHILDMHNVRATFFLIGMHVSGNEALVRRIHDSGHEIGNHSWSHRNLTELSPEGIESDIARAQIAITAAGVPAPRLFRAPYGAINPMVRSHVSLTIVSWNIDPEDWRADSPQEVIDHVLENAKPGAIVDLHDIHEVTSEALDPLLTILEKKYMLVTVSQLLNLSSGQPGIFYSR